MRSIMLLSGGLDNRLAMKMMLDQGVELHAYNHTTSFCTCTSRSSCRHEAARAADEMGVPLTVENVTEKMLRLIENPPHGYGSEVNPCIDCRILLFSRARTLMEKIGAKFVVTGEVLGERPMSQRLEAMGLIEREAGLEDLVVRPLCAKTLPPTRLERKEWVDRNRLKGITGRRRIPQMELAEIPGPLTLFRGPGQEDKIRLAAGITARYSKAREKDSVNVKITAENDGAKRVISVKPAEEGSPGAYRIER
ncbi:MAG: hypothetical protein ACLFT2_07710 [Candidatus Brocadiia bacterium]